MPKSKVKRLVRGAARKTGVARAVRETRESARDLEKKVAGGTGSFRENIRRARKLSRGGKK